MIKLKDILTEDPDYLYVSPDESRLSYTDDCKKYTFLVYEDVKDGIKRYIASDELDNFILHDKNVEKEINNSGQRDIQTHTDIVGLLKSLRRYHKNKFRDEIECDGRFFYSEKHQVWYFSFWRPNEIIRQYKEYIDEFIHDAHINKNIIQFELDGVEINFASYSEFFSVREPSSDYDKNKKLLQRDLHINKAKFDKAVLDVLQSKPKSTHDFYIKLEKTYGKSIAQIRHEFEDLPLDVIISKSFKRTRDIDTKQFGEGRQSLKLKEILLEVASPYIVVGFIDGDLETISANNIESHEKLQEKNWQWWSSRDISEKRIHPWRYNANTQTVYWYAYGAPDEHMKQSVKHEIEKKYPNYHVLKNIMITSNDLKNYQNLMTKAHGIK
jgi:hypothetical protein